jgi:hypothetical protein
MLQSNQRQTEAMVFLADLAGSTTQRAASRGNEVVLASSFISSTHGKSIRCKSAGVQVSESARNRWFAFRDDALAQYASEWLKGLGIAAELERRQK